MNVSDFLKKKVLQILGLFKLNNDPNDGRLTYINDDEAIRLSKIRANKVWFLGDGDELLNWYTNQQTYGWNKNMIYNRNKRQYFWGRSIDEMIKRIHSGIPKAIIDTTCNIVGMPTISGDQEELLDEIFEVNNFEFMLCQQSRPMVLVEGDGAWKININPELCDHPLIEYYGTEDWGPIYKSNVLLGMWFKSYYKDKDDKNYVLFETRTTRKEGLAIEFRLFKLGRNNDLTPCELNKIPELEGLKDKLINGVNCLLAVPIRYYFDPMHPQRGKAIYDGKLDLFDLLDEILTQAGQTNRVSTPVEYYPVDLLNRTKKGVPVLPYMYNRQYVKIDATPDGDGTMNTQIQTTQPDLNFDQYGNIFQDILSDILIGVLSPSSLGIDIAKKDNAEAQREKEKQSLFTRGTIITGETKALLKLCKMLLDAQEYLNTGIFTERDYEISIKYDEFANPSFESELQVLGPAWSSGQISTERFVSLLWAGKLSDEEMAQEIAWLDENKKKDDFDINSLMGKGTEDEDENGNREGLPGEGEEEKAPPLPKE